MSQNRLSSDLRNVGLFAGIIMVVAGLVIGWIKSGHPAQLEQTGGPAPAPGKSDDLFASIMGWITGAGKPPGAV